MWYVYIHITALQYVSTLEAQLSEAAKKNSALIKENEALRAKVKLLEKEVSKNIIHISKYPLLRNVHMYGMYHNFTFYIISDVS